MLIILPVETVQRDFEGRLLLALELAKRGFDSVIGKKGEVHEYMFQCGKPFVYIAKSVDSNLNSKIRKAGGIFTILDEEGGIYTKSLSNVSIRLTDETIPYLDLYFAWGKEIRDDLLHSKDLLQEKQIVVTGNPRFDLCRPEFNNYHQAARCCKEKIKPDYFLINTAFAIVNNQLGRDGRIHFDKTNPFLQEYDKNVGGDYFNPDRISQEEEYQQAIFDDFIEMIHALAVQFSHKDIVIRPHPVENLATYKALFLGVDNVHVVRQGHAQSWINGAAAVIHHDCTTGIEAMLMRKLTISYCPDFDPELVQWLPIEAGYKISDLAELLQVIQKYEEGDKSESFYIDKYDFDLIDRYMANVGLYSAGTIADVISNKTQEWEIKCQSYLGTELSALSTPPKVSLFEKIINKSKGICGGRSGATKDPNLKKLKENKFPGISYDEIRGKVKQFSESVGLSTPASINTIGKNSYLLKAKL